MRTKIVGSDELSSQSLLAEDYVGPGKSIEVVSAVIIDDTGNVLLQKRGERSDFPGYLETPGGKVRPNENHALALRRELFEECCINTMQIWPRPMLGMTIRPPVAEGEVVVTLYFCQTTDQPKSLEDQDGLGYYNLETAWIQQQLMVPSLHVLMQFLGMSGGALKTRNAWLESPR